MNLLPLPAEGRICEIWKRKGGRLEEGTNDRGATHRSAMNTNTGRHRRDIFGHRECSPLAAGARICCENDHFSIRRCWETRLRRYSPLRNNYEQCDGGARYLR
ncbi:hypothetical protein Hypma_000380 [Hypsizygus marmoreus]|uniref:Uncharacterized protein n=1 Tax=Hypsizygus marmoreus TaxID=39966 RepID=A0A369J8E2_HYPMA|nr:hypothetical protein Hypma_000380 [Hypsizygus marmoreus]